MKAKVGAIAAILAASVTLASPAKAQTFTGDVRYACEAILCLAAPTRPGECTTAIRKYFSITARKWKDTIKARKNFLSLCPRSGVDVNAIAHNSTPEWSDPVVPAPPTFPTTPTTRPEIEAEIARLTPLWNEAVQTSSRLYAAVEDCVSRHGRVQDGFCQSEMAAWEPTGTAARAYRDEIYRLQAILATIG